MANQHGKTNTLDRPHIELRCRLDGSMLGLLREFVCTVARHLDFSEKQIAEIEISVDEACANVMEHAYRGRAPEPECKELLVEIAYSGDEMAIRIIDQGDGSGLETLASNKSLQDYVDNPRETYRGLGMLLMQKFMDRVDVRCVPGRGTTVELVKMRQR